MRKGRFLQPADAPLASKTVSGTINHVAVSFWHHGYHNLSHNKHGALDWNLARQLWSYKLSDPNEIQQKAIPLSVLSLIAQAKTMETQLKMTQLIVGALFIACRSCEYLQVKNPEDKQTKILTLENIAFYKNDIEPSHLQASALSSTHQVLITFVPQKNGSKNGTTTQWRTNGKVLCPVVQWAALVQRISNYPGAKPATPVSSIWVHNHILHVTSKIVESALHSRVVAAGKTKLRIHCHKVGTHSIRTGAAMAIYLGGVG
jgi:hypothetical protein